ncbi:MAG: DUF6055 domain-containing protein [Oscillospiraceae bacterium]|nr:DUF6055 domain-containing protein [Oscillospiraceae bacterium]
MRLFTKRAVAFASTAALSLSAIPYVSSSSVSEAADSLLTRDVWCAGEDVNRWESEHFQFIWGKSGADSSKITQSFLEENARHLEACWDVYMNDLSMEPPTQSVNMSLRDGNQYKVNFYISGTGLTPFEDDWAYMGYDSQGYAFMFCSVGAMQNSPNPSWVLPHEFGHVVTAHQLGWNSNKYTQAWWEAIGNWYREQFLYSDYYQQWVTDPASGTDYFETYMKNLCFTPILGRDNYASWAFLQYLTENPDNLDGYGSDFIKNLMQQGQVDEYPYLEIERLSGADLKDTLGHYAKRMATLDLKMQERYRARQNELFARGDWNWGQIYTILEKSGKADNYYTVPTERAPQQMGLNIIPLEVSGDTISVTLEGLTNVKGADWRACIAVEQHDGTTRYSDLFASGDSATMSFDQSRDSAAYLTVTATPDSDTLMQVGVPWAYSEGEFDENNYPFLSKTRYPYAVTIEGAGIKQRQDNSAFAQGSYHPNGGGFVASTANVDDSVYVGKNARVLGYATVSGNAVIDGYATVTGSASVSGNAVVTGNAVVAERAQIMDNAIIGDYAGVMGSAVVSDNARVIESGLVYDNYKVSGNATVKGVAFCMVGGSATGQAMPDGDYYDDSSRTIQAGSMYGWTSPDSYVNSRPYKDGQYAALEFEADSSDVAADMYTSTYGTTYGSPVWSEIKTSGKGVLTFDGNNQYLISDSSYAYLHDADYQTAVLLRDNDANTIFRFGDNEKYMSLTAENGSFTFEINNGSGAQVVKAENAYEPGTWSTVSVILTDDTAKLAVNGITAASGTIAADPIDIVSENASYLIGDGMNGSMDYFRVNFKEVAEPEYYYTEKEEISEESGQVIVGDINLDMSVDIFDMITMRKIILNSELAGSKEIKAAADTNGDNEINIADAVTMQNYLLGRINEFPAGNIVGY